MTQGAPDEPVKLEYRVLPSLPRRKLPAWVWTVIGVYLLLLVGVLLLPLWVAIAEPNDSDLLLMASIVAVIFAVCGLAMIFTPVRAVRERPLNRVSFLIPLVTAGLLMGVLVIGAGFALVELVQGENPGDLWYACIAGGGGVWIGWMIVFAIAARSRDPLSLAGRFHRWLLAGSLAELLVAVPSHLVVRRRTECCAGIYTGAAICLGAMVMLIAFGPSVLLLYWRRVGRISHL